MKHPLAVTNVQVVGTAALETSGSERKSGGSSPAS